MTKKKPETSAYPTTRTQRLTAARHGYPNDATAVDHQRIATAEVRRKRRGVGAD